MSVTFSSFTLETAPATTDLLVGYRSTAAGGERRTTLLSLNSLFQANITSGLTSTAVLLSGASGALTASDLTYSTPTLTVPDSFNVSSAGSISLTAGGTNKNITLTPSGTTGGVVISPNTFNQNGTLQVGQIYTASLRAPTTVSGVLAIDALGFAPSFFGRRFNTSLSSPTAVTSGQNLFSLNGGGYNGSAVADSGAGFSIAAAGNWSTGQNPAQLNFFTTPVGQTGNANRVQILDFGALSLGVNAPTGGTAAWGVNGVVLRTNTGTWIDNSSPTGTVATAVANSFAVPTINSTNASVVYTNLANLYVAGDPATTGNASATNSYGLWNVGKTRVDNGIYFGGTTPGVISGSSGSLALTANGTDQNITLTPSGTGGIGLGVAGSTGQRIKLYGTSVVTTPVEGTWWTSANPGLFGGFSEGTGAGAGDWIFAHASASSNGTNQVYRKARGTLASPAAVSADDTAGGFIGSFHDGGAFRNTASVQFAAESSASSGVAPARIQFSTGETTGRQAVAFFRANGALELGVQSRSSGTAWGSNGINLRTTSGLTFTDTSGGGGTVATITSNSLGTVAFAASTATTYTDAANLRIAGDPTAGTNVTLTNSYGLWNVGKTRLDGRIVVGGVTPTTTTQFHLPAGTTGVSPLRIPHGSAPTSPVDGDMWTTSSGLFIRINGSTVGPLS